MPTMIAYAARALTAVATDTALKSATVYVGRHHVVKATRQRKDYDHGHETYLVTIGEPNFAERRFIAQCIKAGEPFPVKKVQYKFYPGRR